MKLGKIIDELEKIAPPNTALSFDNVGLLVGDNKKEIKNILIALDLTKDVLEEAISNDADLIITHHPLIFNPLKKINNDDPIGNLVMGLIKNDIALFASHTNLDKSIDGTNILLANKLGLSNSAFIDDESLICVVGELKTTTNALIEKIKEVLFLDYVRFVGDDKKQIQKVAVSTGSGDSYNLFSTCKKNGVDTLITGDLTYHTMMYAKDIGLNVIDATHFGTENIIATHLKNILANKLENVTVKASTTSENVFKTL